MDNGKHLYEYDISIGAYRNEEAGSPIRPQFLQIVQCWGILDIGRCILEKGIITRG